MPLYLLWSTLFKIIVCDCCCYTLHSHREFIQTHFATTSTCFIKPLRCRRQPHIQRGKKCKPLQRKKVKKFIVLSSNEFNFLHRMCHRGRGSDKGSQKMDEVGIQSIPVWRQKAGRGFFDWMSHWSWIRNQDMMWWNTNVQFPAQSTQQYTQITMNQRIMGVLGWEHP